MPIALRRYLLLIALSCLGAVSTSAQGLLNSRVDRALDSLGAREYLMYCFSCTDCPAADSCARDESRYLFWKKGSRTFVKRFDLCENFRPVKLGAANPLNYYLRHQEAFARERIAPPTYQRIFRTGDRYDTVQISSSLHGSYFHHISARAQSGAFGTVVDTYYLDTQDWDGLLNVHFESNRRTRTFGLVTRLEQIISYLNNAGYWEPE